MGTMLARAWLQRPLGALVCSLMLGPTKPRRRSRAVAFPKDLVVEKGGHVKIDGNCWVPQIYGEMRDTRLGVFLRQPGGAGPIDMRRSRSDLFAWQA